MPEKSELVLGNTGFYYSVMFLATFFKLCSKIRARLNEWKRKYLRRWKKETNWRLGQSLNVMIFFSKQLTCFFSAYFFFRFHRHDSSSQGSRSLDQTNAASRCSAVWEINTKIEQRNRNKMFFRWQGRTRKSRWTSRGLLTLIETLKHYIAMYLTLLATANILHGCQQPEQKRHTRSSRSIRFITRKTLLRSYQQQVSLTS